MWLPLPHASRSDLRRTLYTWASRYSPDDTCRNRIVERTILSATADPDCLGDGPIEKALQSVMHVIAKEEIGAIRPEQYFYRSTIVGQRYLIVEDDYLIAMELVKMLDEAGATVFGPVGDAERAFDVASDRGFALDGAILDIRLADDTVYSAATELVRRNTPFLFLSGYENTSLPEEFANIPYLVKPCSEANLISTLAAITQGRTGGAGAPETHAARGCLALR